MNRARTREHARSLASSARQFTNGCMDSHTVPIGVLRAIEALANAVDELADVSEDQDGGES